MPVKTLDSRTALVLIDLQKGITAMPTVEPADAIVERAGWPYGLPAPDDTIATRGRTASRKAGLEAVALP